MKVAPQAAALRRQRARAQRMLARMSSRNASCAGGMKRRRKRNIVALCALSNGASSWRMRLQRGVLVYVLL